MRGGTVSWWRRRGLELGFDLTLAGVLLIAWVGAAACGEVADAPDAGGATDAGDARESDRECVQTLTRTRCAEQPCKARQQTFSRPVGDGCGGNKAEGCLVERATGDFYSSPTTSYFDEVEDKFRPCTIEEREELMTPVDAGADAG